MAYVKEDLKPIDKVKLVDPRSKKSKKGEANPYKWWLAENDKEARSPSTIDLRIP